MNKVEKINNKKKKTKKKTKKKKKTYTSSDHVKQVCIVFNFRWKNLGGDALTRYTNGTWKENLSQKVEKKLINRRIAPAPPTPLPLKSHAHFQTM